MSTRPLFLRFVAIFSVGDGLEKVLLQNSRSRAPRGAPAGQLGRGLRTYPEDFEEWAQSIHPSHSTFQV
jgi:hypothetical protein